MIDAIIFFTISVVYDIYDKRMLILNDKAYEVYATAYNHHRIRHCQRNLLIKLDMPVPAIIIP